MKWLHAAETCSLCSTLETIICRVRCLSINTRNIITCVCLCYNWIINNKLLQVLRLWRSERDKCNQFFSCGAAAQRGSWSPWSWRFYITHNDALQTVIFLWTSDQLIAETSTSIWLHTILTTDQNPCPLRDSYPQSQQPSVHRGTKLVSFIKK
jgi:hypothetical protein